MEKTTIRAKTLSGRSHPTTEAVGFPAIVINIELIKAMISVQAELTPVKKDQDGYKFKYANLESIWEVLQPILVKNNLWFTQDVVTENEKEYLVSSLFHIAGGYRTSKIEMKFSGDEIRIFGGACTYYRRYTMQAIFCIVCTEDVDPEKSKPIHKKTYDEKVAHINTNSGEVQNENSYINETQIKKLQSKFESVHKSEKQKVTNMLKVLKSQSFNDIKSKDFDGFDTFISKLINGGDYV